MSAAEAIYQPDRSLKGKLRRRVVRLQHRRPARARPVRPMVSFSFDDAPASAVDVGGAILEQRGLRGTYFIAAGLAGQDGHMGRYADREAICAAAKRGHEIACHTYSHLDCGQAGATAVSADLDRNLAALITWGLPTPTTFAYPFGDVSAPAKWVTRRRFALSRALHHGLVDQGCDLNQAPAVGVEGEDGEALASGWIKRAAQTGGWLILFTHGLGEQPAPYCASADGFARLVDQALGAGLDVVTVAEGARRLAAA